MNYLRRVAGPSCVRLGRHLARRSFHPSSSPLSARPVSYTSVRLLSSSSSSKDKSGPNATSLKEKLKKVNRQKAKTTVPQPEKDQGPMSEMTEAEVRAAMDKLPPEGLISVEEMRRLYPKEKMADIVWDQMRNPRKYWCSKGRRCGEEGSFSLFDFCFIFCSWIFTSKLTHLASNRLCSSSPCRCCRPRFPYPQLRCQEGYSWLDLQRYVCWFVCWWGDGDHPFSLGGPCSSLLPPASPTYLVSTPLLSSPFLSEDKGTDMKLEVKVLNKRFVFASVRTLPFTFSPSPFSCSHATSSHPPAPLPSSLAPVTSFVSRSKSVNTAQTKFSRMWSSSSLWVRDMSWRVLKELC